MNPAEEVYSVSQFVQTLNQIIEYGMPFVRIEGEVTGYKLSKNKWVSFRLRDDESKVSCFMGAWQLNFPLEDGMKVIVSGNPKFKGKYGLFSVNVQRIRPSGEGALERAYQLLKQKLDAEGLFSVVHKQVLPEYPEKIGVISSDGAAGWGDFAQRLSERWPLAKVVFENTLVQGEQAASEIIAALKRLDQRDDLDVIAIVRGGGAKEDLFAFNDETLSRQIFETTLPVVVGVGHERDETLAQLVADVGALTPTHAAEVITPSAEVISKELLSTSRYLGSVHQRLIYRLQSRIAQTETTIKNELKNYYRHLDNRQQRLLGSVSSVIMSFNDNLAMRKQHLVGMSPAQQLQRGFAIVTGADGHIDRASKLSSGQEITIRFNDDSQDATVQ